MAEGGTVSNFYGYLGYSSGSAGEATITGAATQWTNSGVLYIGYEGSGTLTVAEGGTVSIGSGYLGYLSGSAGEATITGPGSQWTNRGDLYVGSGGSGTLTVADGGAVSNSGNLFVGGSGSGTLTVADGGEVTARALFASLSDLHGDGIITVDGAVLDADLRFDTTHPTQMVTALAPAAR